MTKRVMRRQVIDFFKKEDIMDTGEGRFEIFETERELEGLKKQYPKFGSTFQEGERVELRGSKFEISKIIQGGLKLRLLAKGE